MFNLPLILVYVLAGFLGGVTHTAIKTRGILPLPKIDRGQLHLGFLLSGLFGILVAVIVDQHPLTAFFGAIAITHLVEVSVDRVNHRKRGTVDKQPTYIMRFLRSKS
jgi:hypothetical protein